MNVKLINLIVVTRIALNTTSGLHVTARCKNFTVGYCNSSHSCYQPDKHIIVCFQLFKFLNTNFDTNEREYQTLKLINIIVATRMQLPTTVQLYDQRAQLSDERQQEQLILQLNIVNRQCYYAAGCHAIYVSGLSTCSLSADSLAYRLIFREFAATAFM